MEFFLEIGPRDTTGLLRASLHCDDVDAPSIGLDPLTAAREYEHRRSVVQGENLAMSGPQVAHYVLREWYAEEVRKLGPDHIPDWFDILEEL